MRAADVREENVAARTDARIHRSYRDSVLNAGISLSLSLSSLAMLV